VLFLVLALAAAVFLMTRSTGAEQEDVKPAMVTKVYDLSQFFSRSGEGDPRLDSEEDPDTSHLGMMEPREDPDSFLNAALELAHWDLNGKVKCLFSYDSRLIVTNTPEKIAELDRAIASLLPRAARYHVRIALASKDATDLPEFGPVQGTLDDGLRVLKAAGYAPKWITQTTLAPGRKCRLTTWIGVPYVSEQEGLIAELATGFVPVVEILHAGVSLTLQATEAENGLALDCSLREKILKEMKTSKQNGNEIQLPVIPRCTLTRRLAFDKPGTRSLAYSFEKTSCVLLIELQ